MTVNLVSQTVNYRLLEAVVDNTLIQYLKFIKIQNNGVFYEVYRLLEKYLDIIDQRKQARRMFIQGTITLELILPACTVHYIL